MEKEKERFNIFGMSNGRETHKRIGKEKAREVGMQ